MLIIFKIDFTGWFSSSGVMNDVSAKKIRLFLTRIN